MEETQQVPNQNAIIPASPTTTYPTPQPVHTSKAPWLLISLIVVLIGIASYFGYQNYQLKQKLTVQQPTPKPSVVASSPLITSSPIPTTNSTENWKTYTNTKYGFNFSYPQNMVFNDQTGTGGDIEMVPWKSSIVGASSTFLVDIELRSCNNWDDINKILVGNKEAIRFHPEMPRGGIIASSDRVEIQIENKICLVVDKYVEEIDNKGLTAEAEIKKVMDRLSLVDKDVFDAFLSTFKFSK